MNGSISDTNNEIKYTDMYLIGELVFIYPGSQRKAKIFH